MRISLREYAELRHDLESPVRNVASFAELLHSQADRYGLGSETRKHLAALKATVVALQKVQEDTANVVDDYRETLADAKKTRGRTVQRQPVDSGKKPPEVTETEYDAQLRQHLPKLTRLAESLRRDAQRAYESCESDARHSSNEDVAADIREFSGFFREHAERAARFSLSVSGKREHFTIQQALGPLLSKIDPNRTVSMPVEPVPLHGFPVFIERIVENLQRNALSRGEARHVEIAGARKGDYFELTMANDGNAIPAEHQARIFEPFFTTHAHGTGLGLSFSRRVAEEHGGTLELIESRPGRTAFRLRLPIYGTLAHLKSSFLRGLKTIKGLFSR